MPKPKKRQLDAHKPRRKRHSPPRRELPNRRAVETAQPDDAGLEAVADRLAVQEAAEFDALQAAQQSPDADAMEIGRKRRAWLAVSEQLRRVRRDAPGVGKERGSLVARAEVEASMTAMATEIKQALLSLPTSLPPFLVGKDAPTISAELSKAIRAVCESLAAGARGKA